MRQPRRRSRESTQTRYGPTGSPLHLLPDTHRRVFARLILLSLLLVSGSLIAGENSPARIRLVGVDHLADLPTLVAAEQGIFQRHGLDIKLEQGKSGKQNLRALRNGEADIALMATTPLVLELLEHPPTGTAGDPLIVATLVYSGRLNHVVTLTGNGIDLPADLSGRRIGLVKGTNTEFLWWLFSALHRIDPDAARVVDMPAALLPEALIANDIDAAVLWEPWSLKLKDRLGSELVRLPGSDIYIEHWALVTTRGLLQRDPGAIRSLLAAYGDAIDFIQTSPDQVLDLYAAHAGLEAPGALTMQDLPLFGLSLDWSLLTALMETIHWARASSKVGIDQRPDPLTWIESAPLRAAMPIAVGIPNLPAHERAAPP